MEYFCALDANGQRHDLANHPELTQGSVEYLAPQEYMVRFPPPKLATNTTNSTQICAPTVDRMQIEGAFCIKAFEAVKWSIK